jgi:hypothetical protein
MLLRFDIPYGIMLLPVVLKDLLFAKEGGGSVIWFLHRIRG